MHDTIPQIRVSDGPNDYEPSDEGSNGIEHWSAAQNALSRSSEEGMFTIS